MLVRFFEISTNTNDGVYRKSDFINPTTNKFWKTTDTNCPSTLVSQGSFNFDPTDGVSELVIQLTNSSAPMRVTHVVAETEQTGDKNRVVAYAVDSIEYMGNKQIKYYLVEDVFLSHINIVSNTRMLINRTNDESHFFEHDTTDLAYTKERTIINSDLYDYTGKWVVYTAVINADDYSTCKYVFKPLEPKNYELFTDSNALSAKYPDVTTIAPNSIEYFGRIINLNGTLKQAQFNFVTKKISWVTIPASVPTYDDTVNEPPVIFEKNPIEPTASKWVGPSVKLISGDMLTVNFIFPLLDNIYANAIINLNPATYGNVYIPSADRISSILMNGTVDITPYITSKKIVTGLALGEQGTFRPTYASGDKIYLSSNNIKIIHYSAIQGQYYVPKGYGTIATSMSNIYKLSFTAPTIFDHEPFKNYYLNIFGQNIPLKSKLQGKQLTVKSSISSTDWSVSLSVDNSNNVLWSGRISAEMPYSIDKYTEFLAQNSTYNTSKWVNATLGGSTRIATGAISGYMSGNYAGMGAGIASGAVSVGQDIWNYALQEKAMKDSPDTIKGNGVDFGTINISPYGIYLYSMAPTNDSLELMKTEYYAKGFPTNIISTISTLDNYSNDIYDNCKFVAGRMVDMVYNYSITSKISERLKAGVFLLSDPKTVAPEITNVNYNTLTNVITFDVYNKDTKYAIMEATVGGEVKTSGLVTYNDYTIFSFTITYPAISILIYVKATAPGVESSDITSYEYLV